MSRANATHRPLAVALIAVALLTAACGARWTDEQQAQVLAQAPADERAVLEQQSTRTGSAARPGAPTSMPDQATGSVPGDAGGNDGAESAVGESADPGGDADPGAPEARGALPCAAPSDAPGVSDDRLVIGSISSLSGPVAGLGASSAAAVRAYVAYRNATGGICGREVVLREADDGTDNGRYRSVVTDLGPQVLGITGGFALGDVGGRDIIAQQGLPVVNLVGAESVQELPTVFGINPFYEDPDAVIGKYRYLRDQGARTVAVSYLGVDQSRAEARLQQRLMRAAGIEVVLEDELPLSTLSYDSAARRVANSRADYLLFIGDANSNASMARSVADTGYDLAFAEYFVFSYGTNFIERAGAAAAEGAMNWLRTLPTEEAGSNAEVAAFVEWMDRVAPSDVKDMFAADSWASAKAFLDTLEAIPGPISREALLAQLGSVETYDAGGMLGPIRLGAQLTNGCFVAMQVQSGTWRRMAPSEGFLC